MTVSRISHKVNDSKPKIQKSKSLILVIIVNQFLSQWQSVECRKKPSTLEVPIIKFIMSHIFFTPIPVSASWLVKFTTWSLALVRLTLMLMLVLRICSTKHWSWHPFPDSIVSQWKQLCLALPRCHEIAQALGLKYQPTSCSKFSKISPAISKFWMTFSNARNLWIWLGNFQSNLSASIFYSCQGKESARRLLHWLNERAGTVGVQNRTEKYDEYTHVTDIKVWSLPLTNMSLISKLDHFSHPWKLWICTHETLNLHWHRYFFQT